MQAARAAAAPRKTCRGARLRPKIRGMPPVPNAVPAPVRAALAGARAAWPDFAVDEAAFLAHLRARLSPGEDLEAAIPALQLADLYCACACAAGEPRALAAFEKHYVEPAGRSLGHVDGSPEFLAEVKQLFRHKVLLSTGAAPPRIAEYAGRGPLKSWVRAALLRLALNHKRDQQRARGIQPEPESLGKSLLLDPELSFIKHEYRQLFKDALTGAFAALDRRERNVLRLYLLEGMNIERIGIVYQVHRATVARWIAQARKTLAEHTRQRLARHIGQDGAELDACVGLIQSQIELSLSRLLHDGTGTSRPE